MVNPGDFRRILILAIFSNKGRLQITAKGKTYEICDVVVGGVLGCLGNSGWFECLLNGEIVVLDYDEIDSVSEIPQ